MAEQTPNATEFSSAARLLLCAGYVFPPGGMWLGYMTATGHKVNVKPLTDAVLLSALDWLLESGYAQVWEADNRLAVRALHSGAPGFPGALLEATRWQDAYLTTVCGNLMGGESDIPASKLLDHVAREFVDAGILKQSGQLMGYKDIWNPEWVQYLAASWAPELPAAWARLQTLPYARAVHRAWTTSSSTLATSHDMDD